MADLVFWIFVTIISILITGGAMIYGEISRIPRSCKNAAFKEYKARVKQNLEDEEQEFIEWLSEAHMAADRAAFEQFKASRK